MNKWRKLFAFVLAAVLALSLLTSSASAIDVSTSSVVKARHYNVMLVLDGSGSLTMKNGTDVNGYRYDAVQLFLGLMTNSGNYVGAIVFDDSDPMPLNTELRPISGSVAKKDLTDQIRSTVAGGDTDIGSALLAAVEKLKEIQNENGLPSVVILMSDGITDLPHASAEALQQSYDNEEAAISEAAANNIPVYSVLLNGNDSATTGELEHISLGTGGDYQEVKSAEDLSDIYTLFYSLIYNTEAIVIGEANAGNKFIFDEEGQVIITQDVPAFGVEEMNIIANCPTGIEKIVATSPSGEVFEEDELQEETLKSEYYEFVKIEDPAPGLWQFVIHGEPDNEVTINLIFNSDISLTVENADGYASYNGGDTLKVNVRLLDGTAVVTEEAAYQAQYLTLTVTNSANPDESYPMTVKCNGSMYQGTLTLPQVESATTYSVQAVFKAYGLNAEGNALLVDVNPVVGENHPPQTTVPALEYEVEDSGDGYDYVPIAEYFTDEDGDALGFELATSDYNSAEVWLDGDVLVVKADALDGRCSIRATDGIATNLLPIILLINAAPEAVANSVNVQIEVNKLFGGETKEVAVDAWFTDADGDALTYSVVDCDYGYNQNGTITLDQDTGVLIVRTKDFKKSNMVLRATDEAGASCEITIHFKVLNWWLIYGGIVTTILVIAGVIIVVAALAILRRRFKGYIRVENVSAGSFGAAGTSGGFRTSHPSQRKKLTLNSLYGITMGDFSGKCTIVPLSAKKIRFKSPKPFIYNGRKVKAVDISMDSSVTVFATDAPDAIGLCISTESPGGFGGNSFGGNSFGGNSFGGSSGGGNFSSPGSGGSFSW